MATFEEAVEAQRRAFDQKENKISWQLGYLGDTAGVVNTSSSNKILVRYPYENSPAHPVLDLIGVARVPNVRVIVGYLPWMPGVFQIIAASDHRLDVSSLSSDTTITPGGSGVGYNPNVGIHAINHQYLGVDPVYINWRQIMPLGVFPYSGLTVQIRGGYIPRPGVDIYVADQLLDLTSHIPGSGARYVLISYDSTGAVTITDGAINSGGFSALTFADIPDTPAGDWRSCAVALYVGQTAIVETNDERDFFDVRFPEETPAGTTTSSGSVAPYGWLPGWLYRIPITIANSDGTYTNKKVQTDVNTLPLVEAALCKSDLSDLRVTNSDGTTLLTYYRANSALLFNQSNFSRYGGNPILTVGGGGAFDSVWLHPWSVVNNGGTLYMYYGGGNVYTPNKVGLATSTDGLSWTKHVGNPIVSTGTSGQWDETAVEFFSVIKEGANWYAWYRGNSGGSFRTGYATSSDGISWTKYGSNPVLSIGGVGTWDHGGVGNIDVIKVGSTYYMYYWGCTTTGDQSTWSIGLATSTDRVTWTKYAGNPVLAGATGQWDDGVLQGHVAIVGNTWFLFYQGNTPDEAQSHIGLATSPDGINWTRSIYNPFPHGTGGAWDDFWNEGPTIFRWNNQWLLYYMGSHGSAPFQIGVMQFPDTQLWPIVPSLPAGNSTIYLYYGNPAASDVSTGSAGSPDANVTETDGAQQTAILAAWDDETQPASHARDIYDATYTYHLNPANPGTLPVGTVSHVLAYNGTTAHWASAAPIEPLLLEDGTIAVLENGHAAMSEPVFD